MNNISNDKSWKYSDLLIIKIIILIKIKFLMFVEKKCY